MNKRRVTHSLHALAALEEQDAIHSGEHIHVSGFLNAQFIKDW